MEPPYTRYSTTISSAVSYRKSSSAFITAHSCRCARRVTETSGRGTVRVTIRRGSGSQLVVGIIT